MEDSLWTQCLRALESELPEQQFNTWVRPLQAIEVNGSLRLLAPNRFAVEWIRTHALERIQALMGGTGGLQAVAVEVGSRLAPAAETRATSLPRAAGPPQIGARLNPDFTFSSFIEGKSNHFAKAAALQVAENPGRAYNPLFIYGGVGL